MAKYIQTYDELYQIVQKDAIEMLNEDVAALRWNELALELNIAIYPEKYQYLVLHQAFNEPHSTIYQNKLRLQHLDESPQKKVAEILIEKCQEYSDKQLQSKTSAVIFANGTSMLQQYQYQTSQEVKDEWEKQSRKAAYVSELNVEKLKIYTSLMNSFFKTGALIAENADKAYTVENQKDADLHKPFFDQASAEVFKEIADALPDGPEYEPYKKLAGYAAQQPLQFAAAYAPLEIAPNAFANIDLEAYPARILNGNASQLDIHWGATSFDNMMASLYNQDDLNTIKKNGYSFLNTVLIDGRPATEAITEAEGESPEQSEWRLKAKIAAYILEGNKKVEITPYDFSDGSVAITEPIPAIVSPRKNSVITDVYLTTVSLKMEPDPSLNIKANTYPSMIRTAKPAPEHLAWGANAFDNMMKDLYTKEDLETLNTLRHSLVNTIYIDGKPANEVIPAKPGEQQELYEQRAKAEIVAYALEAEKHIQMTPYCISFDRVSLKTAIPVTPIINLEDELPQYTSWQKFQKTLGFNVPLPVITPTKDKANELNEKTQEIQAKVAQATNHAIEISKRDSQSYEMKLAKKRSDRIASHNDEAFLGYLIDGNTLNEGESISDRLNATFTETISAKPVNNDKAVLLKNILSEKTLKRDQPALLNTIARKESRSTLIGLYALSKGMSLDEVLSTDPKYDARKREIGAEFVNKISLMDSNTFNASEQSKGGTVSYETYLQDKKQTMTQMYADLNQTLLNQSVDFLKDCSLENITANYTRINFIAQAAVNVDQSFLEELKNQDSKEISTLADKTYHVQLGMKYIRDYCNYITSKDYAFPACDRPTKNMKDSSKDLISMGVLGRLGIEKLTRDLSSFNSTEPLTAEHAFQNFDQRWIEQTSDLNIKIVNGLEPSTLLGYSELAAAGKNASITYDEVSKTYITAAPQTIEAINKNNSPAVAKALVSFEELTFDQSGKKLVSIDEFERSKESSAMKQSLNHSKQITTHNEEAFFGFITENIAMDPGETISQRLNKDFCTIVSPDPSKANEGLLLTMFRAETRTNLVELYALSKGMPLDEILSSDPKYDARKREIGTEFVNKIALQSPDVFNAIEHARGGTTSYEEYIQNKKQMISQMFVDLNRTVLDQSVDFLKDSSLENLTANYAKLNFLAQASCNADQCFREEDKKLNLAPNKQLSDKNLDAQMSLKSVRDFCEFIASEEYPSPSLHRNQYSQQHVVNGIVGRLAFEKIASLNNTEPLTLDLMLHDLDHTWIRQIYFLPNTLINTINQRTLKEYTEYLTTGKNARIAYDEDSKKFVPRSPETKAEIKNPNINLVKKEWMSFEELSFDQATHTLVSKQTPSRQQNNPTIQKGGK